MFPRLPIVIAAVLAIWVALAALPAQVAAAAIHPPVPTVATVTLAPDGTLTVSVLHDALAFALNDTSVRVGDPAMHALLASPLDEIAAATDDGKARFAIGTRLTVDGRPLPFEIIEAPTLASIQQWKLDHPDLKLPCKMDFVFRAALPADANSLTLQLPEILSSTVVIIERPGIEAIDFPLDPAEVSPAIDVRLSLPSVLSSPAPQTAGTATGTQPAVPLTPGSTGAAPSQRAIVAHSLATDPGPLLTFWRYTKFGFGHIIPQGTDHVLFVLGLFLLCPRIKPVLWQITAFTVAHTLTLTLTSLHIIGLPSSIVEPVIALSIAFIGIENLLTTKVHPWRPAIAFLFGLVHGMGVATAFGEVGFPAGQLVPSLAAFTVGVEAGHLLVLIVAFALLSWSRDKKWYRARIAIPISLLISIVALFWTVQRLLPEAPEEPAAITAAQSPP